MKRNEMKQIFSLNYQFLSIVLLFLLLNVLTNSASINAEPTLSNPYSFISSPSFYSYTVDDNVNGNQNQNQNSVKRYQQQQQMKVEQASNYNNNNNYITFASNSNYRNDNGNNQGLLSNRNYYATINDAKYQMPTTTSTSTQSSLPNRLTPAANGCTLDRLAVYKVVLHTYWTRELFPKHYPDWRPTAQWTKTIGRTHDASYALYHIGQQATAGVKQFAETGKSDVLDSIAGEQQQLQKQQKQQQQQRTQDAIMSNGNLFRATASVGALGNQQQQQQQQQQKSVNSNGNDNINGNISGNGVEQQRSVFDEFYVPAISNGAGRSEAKFFVDSNHSLVSLMTRIVPSPDWFIGVDSFQLCVGGSWIDTVTVEMDPLDAGTDNGFTFTAPNWPTSPQGVIYRITSRYPAHPASSFFYPKSKRLPPIATFQFIKLKEYELSEVFNFAEDDRKYELVSTQTHLETEHSHVEMNNELSASIERERQNEISPQPPTSTPTEKERIRSRLLAKMNPMYNSSNSNSITYDGSTGSSISAISTPTNVVPKNDKNALLQNIADSYRSRTADKILKKQQQQQQQNRRRSKRTRDCRVSHWSEWTPCSKTCGIGEMHRYRKVIKHGKRGGRPCPALQESKWCGSDRGCHSPASYFNWSDT